MRSFLLQPNINIDIASPTGTSSLIFVNSINDLPSPVGGVITLLDNYTYFFTTNVDLVGNRLYVGQNTVIEGTSSENASIISTGLGASPLITHRGGSFPLRNIKIIADIALDMDATGVPNSALDWFSVNFIDCPIIGTIKNYDNFVINTSAFINSGNWTFDGTINTVAFFQCIYTIRDGTTGFIFPNTFLSGRRFNYTYGPIYVGAGSIGISINDINTSFPNPETINLLYIPFSGPGTYLSGLDEFDKQVVSENNTGIPDNAAFVHYYMVNNVTPTVLTTLGTYYKVAGVTGAGAYVNRFTLTNNRATYIGAEGQYFKIGGVVSLSGDANKTISLKVAVNGSVIDSSESLRTTDSGGNVGSVGLQGSVYLAPSSYLEVWASNLTSNASNIVVSVLQLTLDAITK